MSEADRPRFVGAVKAVDVGAAAPTPAWPVLVVVTVFCWFEVNPPFSVDEELFVRFVWLFADVLRPPLVLFAPVEAAVAVPPITAAHAGSPDVPIPGKVPGGQVIAELELVLPRLDPMVFAKLLFAVPPFTAVEVTEGGASVVTCADRYEVSRVTHWMFPRAPK